jgi:PAS domain S-box-containing protein
VNKKLIISASDNSALKLKVLAKKKESVRRKLAVTADSLRLKAKQLAVTAKKKESVRRKLAVTADNLRLKDENLEQVKAKDEAIISSIGDGLVVADKNGNIVLVNKAFEKILGWKEREVRGKLLSKMVPIVDESGQIMPESERLVTKTLKEHTTNTITVNYLRKDKTPLPVTLTVSPIIVEGNFIGAVEVFRDFTKEKEMDKAKTEFVSLASHQLRTPLSSVNWYSEMLLSGDAGELNDKQKKYLEEVYKGNQRMVILVNTLLNVSRLELGTFAVNPEPTDVVKLALSVIDELKLQINQRQLKFDERHSAGLPLLNVDPKLLSMVFHNLLSNAVKYTPEKGKVSLSLRLVKRGESVNKQKMNKDSVAIVVSDTGFGIPKNQQDKIFTKLFRADNAREKDAEGTGLGLYIVKSVIDHSGGLIWFESEENKGTTFYVTLPLTSVKRKEDTKALA